MKNEYVSEFIIGTDQEAGRDYIVRTNRPRFIARVYCDTLEPVDDEEALEAESTGAGQAMVIDLDGEQLVVMIAEWIDPVPPKMAVNLLLENACEAFMEHGADTDELFEQRVIGNTTSS